MPQHYRDWVLGLFWARGQLWAPWSLLPHPENLWQWSWPGVVQPLWLFQLWHRMLTAGLMRHPCWFLWHHAFVPSQRFSFWHLETLCVSRPRQRVQTEGPFEAVPDWKNVCLGGECAGELEQQYCGREVCQEVFVALWQLGEWDLDLWRSHCCWIAFVPADSDVCNALRTMAGPLYLHEGLWPTNCHGLYGSMVNVAMVHDVCYMKAGAWHVMCGAWCMVCDERNKIQAGRESFEG